MTANEELGRSGEIAATLRIAQSLYVAHVSHGRPSITIEHALRVAAAMVGAAQSDEFHALIDSAKKRPAIALADLLRQGANLEKASAAAQQENVRLLAAELRKEQ